jgi:hypothetical protein
MSNMVAALTRSPWDVRVEVKSCIALLLSHLHFEVCLYIHEAIDVLITMLFEI